MDPSDHPTEPSGEDSAADISTALGKWYDANPDVRRLRATEHDSVLHVLIVLEPTPDDDDTLPVWLAKSSRWMNDLRSLTERELHLQMIVPADFDESSLDPEKPMIADLDWRDTFASRGTAG